jgi:hypothetical protein
MNTCNDYRKRICLLALGNLAADDAEPVRRHLRDCEPCRLYFERMKTLCSKMDAFGRESDHVVPSPGLHERVKQSLGRRESGVSVRRWKLIPLAACLAIALGIAMYRYRRPRVPIEPIASVRETSRNVTIIRREETLVAMRGSKLFEGDRIETRAGQQVLLTYDGEDTTVRIREKSSVLIREAPGDRMILLAGGRIEANVAPQAPGTFMTVRTSHARMTVLGTVFSVTASEDTTGLAVEEGTVRMALPSGTAGQSIREGRVAFAKTGLDRLVIPGRLIRSVRAKGLPPRVAFSGVAAAGEHVWVHGRRDRNGPTLLALLDTSTGEVVRKIEPREGFMPESCITYRQGFLWGFGAQGASLKGLDPRDGSVARTISLPVGETSSQRIFDIQGRAGWLRGRRREEIIKIDLDTGSVLKRIVCPFPVDRIAASETAVYAGEQGWNACRIDPETGDISYRFICETGSVAGDMSAGDESRLWVVQGTESVVHVLEGE